MHRLKLTSSVLKKWRGAIVQQQVCDAVMAASNALVQGGGAIRPRRDMVYICSVPSQLQTRTRYQNHFASSGCMPAAEGGESTHQLCTLVMAFGRGD